MSRLRFPIVFSVLCFAASIATIIAVHRVVDVPAGHMPGAMVKLMQGKTHGSGVHIGGGVIITAAHVVPKGANSMTAKLDDKSEHPVEVLWRSDARDVAMVKIADDVRLDTKRLYCHDPKPGDLIFADGNPLAMEGIRTRGYVAGKPFSAGPWKRIIPADIAVGGGMSGGPVLDDRGRLVGITVGTAVQSLGFAGTFIGVSFFVSGATICGLLGRSA